MMLAATLLAMRIPQIWYALPLVVAISLVYAATRHEYMLPIAQHAARLGVWIAGIMAVVAVALYFTCASL